MRKLYRRDLLQLPVSNDLDFDAVPLQSGLGGCPWRVTLASMLLCRTRRHKMQGVFQELLTKWPTPGDLARAETAELEVLLKPLGLYRTRSRQMIRFSLAWVEGTWNELTELNGVGDYVADSVGLICFGDTNIVSEDPALRKLVTRLVSEARTAAAER